MLDALQHTGKKAPAMTSKHLILAAATAVSLTLSACGESEPEVVGGTPDPMARELANAAPVELPPSITASRTYRCRDNSLAYVEFFNNNTANFRLEQGAEPTRLTAESAGGPYTADGITVSGSGSSVTIARPGAASQSCNSN